MAGKPQQQQIEEAAGRQDAWRTLKALSIRQPYAGLIMAGIKNVENRSWLTRYAGPLAIVSTKNPDAAKWWGPMRGKCQKLGVAFPEELCRINGAVLGVVDFNYLIGYDAEGFAVTDHPTLTPVDFKDWWDPDMIGFIFENPRVLNTPIPISGRLSLYTLPPEVAAKVIEQLRPAA